MQNVVVNMCEKFHNDQLRNDKTLTTIADNKKNNNRKNNLGGGWRPVSGSNKLINIYIGGQY